MKVIICETYSRVCGFFRPIFQNWNAGKIAEYKDRKNYDPAKSLNHDDQPAGKWAVRDLLVEEGVIRCSPARSENNSPAGC